MLLNGKIAVVSGAGSGIGKATAIRLAKEGAKLGLLDINEENANDTVKEIQAFGGTSIAIKTDISLRDDVFKAAELVEQTYGKIDIWVNCAGYSKILPFLECTDEIWDRTMNINLKGCFLGCQAAITHMNPAGGAIVNFSSESGKKRN